MEFNSKLWNLSLETAFLIRIDIFVGWIIPCRIIRRNLSPNYSRLLYQHQRHVVCLRDTRPTLRTVKYRT